MGVSASFPLFEAVSFEDVDHFSDWEARLGWEVASTQLSCGVNSIGFDQLAFEGLTVNHFRARQSMQCVFAVPEGLVVFDICRRRVPAVWCGSDVPPSLVGLVRPGREHWVVHPPGWDAYEFLVSEELIRRTELFPPEFFERTASIERPTLPLVEPETSRLLEVLDLIFGLARAGWIEAGAAASGASERELFDFVLDELRRVIDAGLATAGLDPLRSARRADLVPRARDLMAAELMNSLTAEEIADRLGVSYRVLHYAFRDALGMSPYRYFLTLKLHAVRRRLKAGDVPVTAASIDYGFEHFGRLAQHYKRLFGEAPSETKRQRRRAVVGLGTSLA